MRPERFSLTGKVALVTGASRGIGRAIALTLAEAGATVAVASRTIEDLEAVASEIERIYGRPALPLRMDVSRADEVNAAAERLVDEFGRIDILVNNAGISPTYTRAINLSEEEWRRTLDVNLTGTFLVCQAIGRHMIEMRQGSVINVGSIGSRVGLPRLAAYCASKAGIEALTRVLALEWVEYGVRVNAVGPGFVTTEMTAGLRGNPYLREVLLKQTPVGRFGEPDDVSGAVLYLASDASRFVTGQILFVDGGWLAQ